MSGQVQTRRSFLPSFDNCCVPSSRCRSRHALMHQHFAMLRADFEAGLAADRAKIKATLARDLNYLDEHIKAFDISAQHFSAEVEGYFDSVATKMSLKLSHETEEIKIALKHVGKELGLDLIKLLKSANIIETKLQRICEILIEILIQIHAANIPPITEVQEGILGAILALGALDLVMSGDKMLNDKIRERLGDTTVDPKLGPLGEAIMIGKDDLTPGVAHLLLVGEAMGLVPMGSATAVRFALGGAFDKALHMDQLANQKVTAAETEVTGTINSITSRLMAPVHYVGSVGAWISASVGISNHKATPDLSAPQPRTS